MIRMFVRHKVADFVRWKRDYDDSELMRHQLGVLNDAVFRGAIEAGDVTLWHDFDTMLTALAYVKSREHAGSLERSGVLGEPQIWYVAREL